ncbi:MAG TPA: CapA family protein [Anaerolineales bacterium]|nr:CapA family protein [Anaerolineales bacterium]
MTRSSASFLIITLAFLLSCSGLSEHDRPSESSVTTPTAELPALSTVTPMPASTQQDQANELFVGRVIDMQGTPIPGASVASRNNATTSDKDGWFRLPAQRLPQWIKVTGPGYISRTRAATPGMPVLFRLTPDDGKTIVIHFAGDTMFGRRFFDLNEDGYTADGLLPLEPTVDDHMRLLAPIKPLLENADFTVVNLETTLSDQAYWPKADPRPAAFHPSAAQVYASYPTSVIALKQSGIDVVGLANNHNYDMLEAGLNHSLSILDGAGMLHFGAGTSEAGAWAPVTISLKGQTIALIGCTTLRIPTNTPIKNDVPYVASDLLKKGGAAYCAEARLRSEILKAKQQAAIIIVMIHGGKEYDPTPTNKISYLSEIARQAGATLVINHHPHVVGGFSVKNQSLIAWTIGNFLTDQTAWPTSQSYMLAVYLRDGKVVRAYIEPLMIDRYLPHGLTDELADYVVRGAAGHEHGPFIMESGAMEVDLNGRAIQAHYTQSISGGPAPGTIIPVPQAHWISDFQGTGNLFLGRDLLWVGGFENDEIDSTSHGAPLWELDMGGIRFGSDFAYEGEIGIRLARSGKSANDAVTSNLRRVLFEPLTSLSITGMLRTIQGAKVLAQLHWYDATFGPSFTKETHQIEVQSYGVWQPFRIDAKAPGNAVALRLYLRLSPPGPNAGTITADFDNIRIIEWARPRAQYSPLYNYALLTGIGELTFTQAALPGAEQWFIPTSDKKTNRK